MASDQFGILKSFMPLVSEGVVVESIDHRLLAWNSAAEKYFDILPGTATGKLRSEVLVPIDSSENAIVESALKSTGSWSGDIVYRGHNGRMHHLYSRRQQLKDADGTIQGWVEVCTDKSCEHDVKSQMQLLQNLQSIFSETRELSVEQALEQFADIAISQLGETCIIDLIGDDELIRRIAFKSKLAELQIHAKFLKSEIPMFQGALPTAARVLRTSRYVMTNPVTDLASYLGLSKDSNGSGFKLDTPQMALSLPILSLGKPIGIITILRSSTPFTELDANALKQYLAVLGHLIEKIRLNQRLHLETLKSESAALYKDAFLGTLSHELRTPLQAMLGWTQLLRDAKLAPSAQSKALDSLERSIKAQSKIINDLLELSRISTGRLELDAHPCELLVAISTVMQSLQVSAKAKQISISLTPPPGPPVWISADMEWLNRAFWNILSNAIKFTPQGSSVTVSIKPGTKYVEVVITDAGKGIDPAYLPFVFERFSQAEFGTTRTYGGLGIGLSIVRFIVEAHGGSVEAKSEGINKGASFIVTLPVCAAPKVRELNKSKPVVAEEPSLQGVRILLVEDEKDTRELLKFVLESSGAHVTDADSAKQGWEAFKQHGFDVLISDIGMPEEDGYSLIRRIRALPAPDGGAIPAMALTAYIRPEDRIRMLRAGFHIHVAKPVEPSELIMVVSSLANRSSQSMAKIGNS